MLDELVLAVLEETAFLVADPVTADELPDCGGDWTCAALTLSGDRHGRVQICAATEFTHELAESMLGEQVEASGPEAGDALCELCNVLAGHWITQFLGAELAIGLSPPGLVECADPAAADAYFDAEGFPLTVKVTMEEDA